MQANIWVCRVEDTEHMAWGVQEIIAGAQSPLGMDQPWWVSWVGMVRDSTGWASGYLRPFIHYTALPGSLENIFCSRVVGKIDLFLKSRDTPVFYLGHESPQTKWDIGVTNAQHCLEKRRAQRQHLVLSSRQSHRGADVIPVFYFLKQLYGSMVYLK